MSMNPDQSQPSEWMNYGQTPPPPQRSRGSGLLMGLGIGCGVVVVLCCGGGILFTYLITSMAKTAMTDDPQKIQEISREIAEVTPPDGWQPVFGINLRIPFVNMPAVKVAAYEGADKSGTLFVAEVPSAITQGDPERARQQIEDAISNSGRDADREGDADNLVFEGAPRELELTIRGKPAKFTIRRGKDSQSGAEYIVGTGVFEGKSGTGFVLISAPADKYTEDDVENVLKSIK